MPKFTDATVVPNSARALLGLVASRGHAPERVCRGLGFRYRDLLQEDMRLSYRQIRLLITRTQRLLGDPALGLSAGARQSPMSWGVAGLAMLTCETLGEAVAFGLAHQPHLGALIEQSMQIHRDEVFVMARQRLSDLALEPFLIEDAFAGAVAVVRHLVGEDFRPLRVELAYARPAHADAYERFFRCPVRFAAPANRIVSAKRWLAMRLPSYDKSTCGPLQAGLRRLLQRPAGQSDLVESIAVQLRTSLDAQLSLQEVAQQLNLSERTLRRRLTEEQTSYRALLDDARLERARDLLHSTRLTMQEIAAATGFADARSFRRAFQRWSGTLPGQSRPARQRSTGAQAPRGSEWPA